jgi:ribosomal 30S subunit maturation factor RimM
VVADGGRDVGTVVRIDDGGVTLLAVDGGTAGEILVPMVDAICRRIDVGQKVIEIVPVDGLLDLNVTGRRA